MRVNTEKIEELLFQLDLFLTGKSKQESQFIFSFDDFWWGQAYHLSDGEYSRIFYSPEKEEIFLTDNSLKKVKYRWTLDKSIELRNRIKIEIKNIYYKIERKTVKMKTTGLHKIY